MILTNTITTTQDVMRQIVLDWIPENSKVIELGCSDGNFASILKNKKIQYLGVDILKNKIKEAIDTVKNRKFINCNILQNLNLLKNQDLFISFQCLEHIKGDLLILKNLDEGTNAIFSVPNSPYRGHIRWFELDGWKERYEKYIEFSDIYIIQNPRKNNKRSFLFRGVRK